jgi:3-methylcrotonyl-CoA carboxylase beta subunit
VDYKMPNDATCIQKIRQLVSNLPHPDYQHFVRHEVKSPLRNAEEVYNIVPENRGKQYNTHELLECLFDEGSMLEYKADYGKSIVTAYGNIDGWAVGVVANQRMVVKSQRGEMQFGGVIYSDSADKAARFIMTCNQKKLPLVFLHDVTGFMVGSRSEHGGIIKDGAKMVNAMANSVVPKFTVVVGNSYGAGNYAMCGKAYDPRLMLAWPTARIAVMGGEQAAKTRLQIQVSSLKGQGQVITPEDENTLLTTITERYQAQTLPEYAAARLWVDAIIEPHRTREWLSAGIQAANHQKITKEYKTGVIQT